MCATTMNLILTNLIVAILKSIQECVQNVFVTWMSLGMKVMVRMTVCAIFDSFQYQICITGRCLGSLIGDGICNDECNNEGFAYDHGDCCLPMEYSRSRKECTACQCHKLVTLDMFSSSVKSGTYIPNYVCKIYTSII